ncbi:MAG: hypothetical protein KTR31_26655 [Myxococcales bacterium]|nr:hypothetical protein [Myxococcales bacterium]
MPARITLPAHQGVRYTFELPTDSRVRLRSEGTTGSFRCRLMDADDWPLTAPEVPCDRTVTLTAGRYAVLGLPEGVQTRRITTLEVLDDAAAAREGHGPHALQVGQTVTHVWREPIDGSERAPDVWRLDVPAPVDARVSLSDEMVATWMRDGATLGRVVPGQGWSGRLEAGEVELHVTGARRGTGVPYTLRVDSQQLVAGTQRSVSVPARLEVAVGRAQVITLRSAGRTDVAARLFDAIGQLVAANDDRPDDWNFQITERLEPGTYALQLEPVGRRGGSAVVEMLAPDERQEEPLALGQTRTLEGHAGASQLPLRFGSGRDVVVATATADENVGVALEVRVDDAWRGLGTATGRQAQLVARLPEAVSEARLRVWSEDRRGGDIAVQAQALRARPVALGALDVGSGGRFGAVRLGGSEGGVFDLSEARGDVYACPERGAVCGVISTSVVGAGSDGLVLVSRKRVRARRVKLAPGQRRTLRIGSQPQPVALEPGRGPSVVVVRSSAGQAGATFARQVGPSGMAVSTGGTLAVSVDGADRARIWDAQPTGAAMDARVTSMRLSSPSATKLAPGRHALTVPARGSLALRLPGGRHDLEVSLDVGLVVATSEGQVLWADADPLAVRLPAVDKRVWLLNPGASDALARVHVGEAGAQATLAGDAPAERLSARMLTEVLTLSGDAGTLRTSGAVSAVVLAADGRVLRGRAIEVDGPGRVLLAFEPGAALAWIEATAGSGPVTDPGAGRSATVRAGDRVVLEGALQRLKLKATGPAVAHLTVPAPLVASYDAGGEARVEVRQPGESLDLWLADGSGELSLRAFTGAALWGVVQVSTSEPEVIGEGLGAEVLLEPGGSHWFRFEVERAGPVGFGVQARADRVEATVRDDAGIAVARGVVGMVELQPGSYFLQLSQPAGRAPVSARPALAGIEPPAPGPPEDVVKGYVQVADPSD